MNLIQGIHHVTATVDDAQEDYDFYTKILGLRFIKETVNFDNEAVYHFYYGNEKGEPSTVFTTFPYKNQGVRQGVIGSGQATETIFSAPKGAETFWQAQLAAHQIDVDKQNLFSHQLLKFKDPSGLRLGILFQDVDERKAYVHGKFSEQVAIKGMDSVVLEVEKPAETAQFLIKFGYHEAKQDGVFTFYETAKARSGNRLILRNVSEGVKGINGLGTIHHVAHRVQNEAELLAVRKYVEEDLGLRITEVKDRKYFKSIYFRIPGGVLFEVATNEPGFTVDESVDQLGASLKLPPWQEVRRAEIEENLLPFTKN